MSSRNLGLNLLTVPVALALHRLVLQAGQALSQRVHHARVDQVAVGPHAVGQRQSGALGISL